jgi:quercetin dioxygenase-like cupin family protein
MQRFLLPVFAALLSVADHSVAQPPVEIKGIASKIRLEEVVSGHLAELNGKFKLRVTEVTFAPGGQLGPHHHVGPGIRYVISGKVTFVEGGTTTVYAAGDYFYESGNIAHTAYNGTKAPLRVAFFEILPTDWTGPSVIAPKAY